MINISTNTFIVLSSQKMGEPHLHHLGKIFTYILSDIYANHIKNSLGLLLNLLENTYNLLVHLFLLSWALLPSFKVFLQTFYRKSAFFSTSSEFTQNIINYLYLLKTKPPFLGGFVLKTLSIITRE